MGLRISHLISISFLLALGTVGIVYTIFSSVEDGATPLRVKEVTLIPDRTKLEFVLEGSILMAEPVRPVAKLSSGLKRYSIEANTDYLLMPSQSNTILLDFDTLAIDNGEYTLEAYLLTTEGRTDILTRTFEKKGGAMTITEPIEAQSPLLAVFLAGVVTTAALVFLLARQRLPLQNLFTTPSKEAETSTVKEANEDKSKDDKVALPPGTVAQDIIDKEQLGKDLQRLRELCEQNIIDIETYKTKRQEILKKLLPQQS